MLRHEDGGRQVGGERRAEPLEGLDTSGRSPNYHDIPSRHHSSFPTCNEGNAFEVQDR